MKHKHLSWLMIFMLFPLANYGKDNPRKKVIRIPMYIYAEQITVDKGYVDKGNALHSLDSIFTYNFARSIDSVRITISDNSEMAQEQAVAMKRYLTWKYPHVGPESVTLTLTEAKDSILYKDPPRRLLTIFATCSPVDQLAPPAPVVSKSVPIKEPISLPIQTPKETTPAIDTKLKQEIAIQKEKEVAPRQEVKVVVQKDETNLKQAEPAPIKTKKTLLKEKKSSTKASSPVVGTEPEKEIPPARAALRRAGTSAK